MIGSSNDRPQIILFSNDNVLACQFHIHPHYPGSVKILQNFVNAKMRELKSNAAALKSLDLDILEVDENLFDCGKNLQKNQRKFTPFVHSGFTVASKRLTY